jgi:hypothetical protein
MDVICKRLDSLGEKRKSREKLLCRIFTLCITCVAVSIFCSGCGNGTSQDEKKPDVHEIAEMLLDEITFEDNLSEVVSARALDYYSINSQDVEDSVTYMSTGATAEELAIFEATSETEARYIYTCMEGRRDSQIKTFMDYKSQEVTRLDEAIIYIHGKYVVYMVCDDTEKASGIIKECLE